MNLKVLNARNLKSSRGMNVMLKFESSSNKCKRKNKLLNSVRFNCFLSFKAKGTKGRQEEKRRTVDEISKDKKRAYEEK